MNTAERRAIIERMPWVTAAIGDRPCDGIKWGSVSSRDLYAWGARSNHKPPRGIPEKALCKNHATWRIVTLEPRLVVRDGVQSRTRTLFYCWSHFFHVGLYGSISDTRRADMWLRRNCPEVFTVGEVASRG